MIVTVDFGHGGIPYVRLEAEGYKDATSLVAAKDAMMSGYGTLSSYRRADGEEADIVLTCGLAKWPEVQALPPEK